MIGGHDKHRIASKLGDEQARVLAMLSLTLRGTPFLYMGDEIGQERVKIPPERVHDPFEKLVPGYDLCRDPERAPVRWDDSQNGGFTNAEPWLPLDKKRERNREAQRQDERSILQLYRQLLRLRRESPCLQQGKYQPVRSRNDVLSYQRVLGRSRIIVGLNITPEPRKWEWQGRGKLLLSTKLDRSAQTIEGPMLLRANEGLLVELDAV